MRIIFDLIILVSLIMLIIYLIDFKKKHDGPAIKPKPIPVPDIEVNTNSVNRQ